MELSIQKICSNKSNNWLILVHGFLGSSEDWKEVIFRLSDNWNYLLIDLPGHGNSPKTNRKRFYSMDWVASVILEKIKRINPDRLGILGYSMGGRVALHVAEQGEKWVDMLILESASPGIEDPLMREERRKWDEEQARILLNQGLEEFLDYWYQLPVFNTLQAHPKFQQLKRRRLQNSISGLARAMKWMGTGSMRPFYTFLKETSLDVYYLCGEKDKKYVNTGKKLKARNNNLELIVFRNAGHNVHFEQTKSFARVVNKILGKYS